VYELIFFFFFCVCVLLYDLHNKINKIAMIVIRRTLLSNLNDHRIVIIQYYFASNSEHGRINQYDSYAMAWGPPVQGKRWRDNFFYI